MKQELLEYIIRECAKEVIAQIKEEEEKKDDKDDGETKGAPAPPADDQGTGDAPGLATNKPEIPGAPSGKETPPTPPEGTAGEPSEPDVPTSPELKGVIFVNPRDKSRLQKTDLKTSDDSTLERTLHRVASMAAGSKVKIALATMRAVKDALRNPGTSLYLYVGKYDPNSDEVFLMADRSLQVAKSQSVPSAELSVGTAPLAPQGFNPMAASGAEFAQRMSARGQTMPQPVDEVLRKSIKEMVDQILDQS